MDRDNEIVRGYVVAQTGIFKDRRGEFDTKSLMSVVSLMRQNRHGTPVHLGHVTLSDDGIGTRIGMAKNPRLDGEDMVRADLFLSPNSHKLSWDMGEYVLSMAETEPEAFSSSLVLMADEEWHKDKKGELVRDKDGEPVPALWRPTRILASDVVEVGNAVDAFLSPDTRGKRDELHRMAFGLLQQRFQNVPDDVVRDRFGAFIEKYLSCREQGQESFDVDEVLGKAEQAAELTPAQWRERLAETQKVLQQWTDKKDG